MNLIFQITFYEDRNFQGGSYECMSDCADMSSHMSRCHSCKVESGCFVIYDRTNYMGNQYFLKSGEYPDYMNMMGMCSGIRSCRMIPMVGIRIKERLTHNWFYSYGLYFNQLRLLLNSKTQHKGQYKMKIYERENFGGQSNEMMEDCDNIQDRYSMSDCQSCHVMDGHWLTYEQPQYRGRMMYMRPGEYRSFKDMGYDGVRFHSFRRIMDSC